MLPSTRPGAEQQQQENTGLCCLSRSPLDTFWTLSPSGRSSIEALLYWGTCERTADLSAVSNVTRYCNKVSLHWQSWVCLHIFILYVCVGQHGYIREHSAVCASMCVSVATSIAFYNNCTEIRNTGKNWLQVTDRQMIHMPLHKKSAISKYTYYHNFFTE